MSIVNDAEERKVLLVSLAAALLFAERLHPRLGADTSPQAQARSAFERAATFIEVMKEYT